MSFLKIYNINIYVLLPVLNSFSSNDHPFRSKRRSCEPVGDLDHDFWIVDRVTLCSATGGFERWVGGGFSTGLNQNWLMLCLFQACAWGGVS